MRCHAWLVSGSGSRVHASTHTPDPDVNDVAVIELRIILPIAEEGATRIVVSMIKCADGFQGYVPAIAIATFDSAR